MPGFLWPDRSAREEQQRTPLDFPDGVSWLFRDDPTRAEGYFGGSGHEPTNALYTDMWTDSCHRPGFRNADEAEPAIDPFTRDEAAHLVAIARDRLPEWHAWVLCGLRTGMRAGELLALQWGDVNWRHGFVQVQRNLVRGQLTTPKNHQARRVDLSGQLRAVLRLWRRQQRMAWL